MPNSWLSTPQHYEELIERAEDAAAVAAYRKTRNEEAFPAEMLDRMLEGEHLSESGDSTAA